MRAGEKWQVEEARLLLERGRITSKQRQLAIDLARVDTLLDALYETKDLAAELDREGTAGVDVGKGNSA